MSSDMALRFSGLLKVMTPTPSATLCRILPSAKDLSALLGTSSIGAAFGVWTLMHRIEALVRCLGNGGALPLPLWGKAIAYGIFQRVVPANAGTHTARTLASALEQRPFFTSEARGYGCLRSQGGPAERLYEATTASTYGSIQSYAIAVPRVGRAGRTFRLLICPTGKSPISCPAPFAKIF